MPNPVGDNTPDVRVAQLEARLAALERPQPDSFAWYGPRTDLTSGWGVRVRVGVLSDGAFGVEIFNEDGSKASANPKFIGEIFAWPGDALPEKSVWADGGTYFRTDYPELFTALGGTSSPWGLPASDTFRVPDARGKVLVSKGSSGTFATLAGTGGVETIALTTAMLPSHNHGVGSLAISPNPHSHNEFSNLASSGTSNANITTGGGSYFLHDNATGDTSLSISGSTANAGSGSSHSNVQPYVVVNAAIYAGR